MYRILMFVCTVLFPGTAALFAADTASEYQLGWVMENGTVVYGDAFSGTSAEASKKLAWSNQYDPSTKHWVASRSAESRGRSVIAEPADERHWKILYRISMAAVAGANAMDIASSYGKQEVNPLFRDSGGTFDARSAMLKTGLLGGLQLSNYMVVRSHPAYMKRAVIMNFVAAGLFTGLAVHNFGIRAEH